MGWEGARWRMGLVAWRTEAAWGGPGSSEVATWYRALCPCHRARVLTYDVGPGSHPTPLEHV